MLLTKFPTPEPLVVFVVKLIVGFCKVLQTTPLSEIAPPPADEIVPPEFAVVEVIFDIEIVDKVGN